MHDAGRVRFGEPGKERTEMLTLHRREALVSYPRARAWECSRPSELRLAFSLRPVQARNRLRKLGHRSGLGNHAACLRARFTIDRRGLRGSG